MKQLILEQARADFLNSLTGKNRSSATIRAVFDNLKLDLPHSR
jgi:hypothetical protein